MANRAGVVIVEDRSLIKVEDGRTVPVVSPETLIDYIEEEPWVFYHNKPICALGRKKVLDNIYVHKEPGYTVGRCKMIVRSGERCRNGVRDGWTVCHKHGAGRPSRPGGQNDINIQQGRYAKVLPDRLLEKYDEFLGHPETLSMYSELALLDSRIAEIVERLDTTDTAMAWTKIKLAMRRLDRDELDGDDIDHVLDLLDQAVTSKQDDEAIWKQITTLIEQRRKLAETERRRVVEAKQIMTIEEANRFMAYVLHLIQTHVSSAEEKRAIADGLKRIA